MSFLLVMLTKRIRLESGTAVYHCIARVVGGEMLLGTPEKEQFRKLMWKLARFCGVEVITYCIMTNHVHLLVRVPADISLSDAELCDRLTDYYGRREPWVQMIVASVRRGEGILPSTRDRLRSRMGDVSMFMRTLKQRFAKWYNRRHERFGTLWAERFKSVLVEDGSAALGIVAMYIDLNPLRAGLVEDPKDYRFCGHAEALAGNREIRRAIAGLCGRSTWSKAAADYRCRMMLHAGEPRGGKMALSKKQVLAALRRGGRVETAELLRLRLRYLTDGVVFGSRQFVDAVFTEFRDRFGPRRQTGARPLRTGGELKGFATARDLRKDVVG